VLQCWPTPTLCESWAMQTLTEAAQMFYRQVRAGRVGDWHIWAQTATGERALGGSDHAGPDFVTALYLRLRLQPCPVCGGVGERRGVTGGDLVHCCPVCNGSGICRPKHWLKWQRWQVVEMAREFGRVAPGGKYWGEGA
jgi:hypothetical protein